MDDMCVVCGEAVQVFYGLCHKCKKRSRTYSHVVYYPCDHCPAFNINECKWRLEDDKCRWVHRGI